jgi:hypothetical protein
VPRCDHMSRIARAALRTSSSRLIAPLTRKTVQQPPPPVIRFPPHMKAIAYDAYGPLEALALRDVPRPTVKDGEVLVRVRAASLAIGDVFSVGGAPYAMRMYTGLLKPKWGVPGYDLAVTAEDAMTADWARLPYDLLAKIANRIVTRSRR